MGSKKQVLIVGAGITGSFTAFQLNGKFMDSIALTVLDKSRGAGGRMATNRLGHEKKLACDHGAQYISVTPEYQVKHSRYYNELLNSGILKPFKGVIAGENKYDSPGLKNFIASNGLSSVVKNYLKDSGASMKFGETCEVIDLSDDKTKWKVQCNAGSSVTVADSVVLTMPVPQILNLKGDIITLLEPFKANLAKVEYSSRYSLIMYFDWHLDLDFPWTCKYFSDDCVAFISVDTLKREQDPSVGTSILIHTNVPFGLKYLDNDFKIVEPLIRERVQALLPNLPEPTATKCHRWRYSQVYKGYPGSPGCLVIHEKPLLILGGDAFARSNFDNCLDCSETILGAFSDYSVGSKC